MANAPHKTAAAPKSGEDDADKNDTVDSGAKNQDEAALAASRPAPGVDTGRGAPAVSDIEKTGATEGGPLEGVGVVDVNTATVANSMPLVAVDSRFDTRVHIRKANAEAKGGFDYMLVEPIDAQEHARHGWERVPQVELVDASSAMDAMAAEVASNTAGEELPGEVSMLQGGARGVSGGDQGGSSAH